MTKVSNGYIINLTRKEVIKIIDMFDIFEAPKEETKVEQFIPLEELEESTKQIETVSKQDYDSLVKTIEELKSLITANKE